MKQVWSFTSLWLLLLLFLLFYYTTETQGLKVLIFTKTTSGSPHPNTEASINAIESFGATRGWLVDHTSDSTLFDAETTLSSYDVVVFSYTYGDIFSANQRYIFQNWFSAGGRGWVGIHSAAATEMDWPWYTSLVGASARGDSRSPVQPVVLRVADRVHPATAHLPKRWLLKESVFNFDNSSDTIRKHNHVLFDADEKNFTGGHMGVDHPMAWCKLYSKGRSVYTALGGYEGVWDDPDFLDHIQNAISWAGGLVPGDCGATLDSSYQKEIVFRFNGYEQPMSLAVLPSGLILFSVRSGRIRTFDPATSAVKLVATLKVYNVVDDGLIDLILDTQFAQTGFMYVYWSPLDEQQPGNESNTLSRFQIDVNTGVMDMESRVDLLKVPVERKDSAHTAGSLNWDPDGNLLLATGDNTSPYQSHGSAPIDERPGRVLFDAQRSAGNTNDLRGKILRINISRSTGVDDDEGPKYSIPIGNLFGTEASEWTRPEIYAMGLRNPFKVTVDPITGTTYVGDVGPDAIDTLRGPLGYDQLLTIPMNSPRNFGWPYCRGDLQPYLDYSFEESENETLEGEPFDCLNLVNRSPNNNGMIDLPPASPATIWYPYAPSNEFPEMDGEGEISRSALALHVFRPTDYEDYQGLSSTRLPDYFQDGTLLFADWARDYFREIKFDDEFNVLKINKLWSSFTWHHPIDVAISPYDGSVYILEFGNNYVGTGAALSRMRYVGVSSKIPTCVILTDTTLGPLPLTVSFSGDVTADPDGGGITYSWDFNSDGIIDSNDPNATFVYTQHGDFVVSLTVENKLGSHCYT